MHERPEPRCELIYDPYQPQTLLVHHKLHISAGNEQEDINSTRSGVTGDWMWSNVVAFGGLAENVFDEISNDYITF